MLAAAAARSILTRLHEVMAARTHAQGKLNQVVEIIGQALDSEVCSMVMRGWWNTAWPEAKPLTSCSPASTS